MDNFTRKKAADRILYEFGLMEQLEKLGVPHIIGSYRMDMMAWNDLDIDIENDNMSMEKLYELSSYIIKSFHPVWYEAKEEISESGKAEAYCDGIASKTNEEQKDIIVNLKKDLIERGLYSFEQYKSIDVYKAVVEENVRTIDEFLNGEIS